MAPSSITRRNALGALAGASVLVGSSMVVGASPAWAADALVSGGSLAKGQSLTSGNRAYRLIMQTDGNLVLYKASTVLWASNTAGQGVRANMQTDGNLVVRRSDGSAAWASGTNGFPGTLLRVKDDGNLAMYQNGLAVWSRVHGGAVYHQMRGGWTMRKNQFRLSRDRRFKFIMQGDGNLVLYRVGGGALWESRTRGSDNRAVMQTDGNLVVYSSGNAALWSSRTAGRTGSVLTIQNDGNVVLRQASTAVWATNTVISTGGSSTLSTKVDAFVSTYQGRHVDFDGWYGAQCVDLFNFYNRDVVKASHIGVSYAWQLWDKAPSAKYSRISAGTTPRKGDVAVWSSAVGGGTGHVAIVLSQPTSSTVRVFSQNWPLNAACRTIDISKAHLRGYLRPLL